MSGNTKYIFFAAKLAGVLFCAIALTVCMSAYWLELPESTVQQFPLIQDLVNLTPKNFLPADYNFLVAGYPTGLFFLCPGIFLIALSALKGPALLSDFTRPKSSLPFDLRPRIWIFVALLVGVMFLVASKAEVHWAVFWLWFSCLIMLSLIIRHWDKGNNRHFLTSREWILLLLQIAVVIALPKIGDLPGGRWVIFLSGIFLLILGPKYVSLDEGSLRLLGLILLAFFLYSHNFLHWRHSAIGDELAHYGTSEAVSLGKMSETIASCRGTYQQHPLSAAYFQATAMLLYGINIYGWRMSETLAVLLAAFPFHYLARTLAGRRAGLFATVIFLFSPHLVAFTRIGYNQCQGLVALLLPMACGLLAIKRQSLLGFFLTGVTLALAFYTFGLALPFMVLTPLLLLTQKSFLRSQNMNWLLLGSLIFIMGLATAASPRIMDREWIYDMTRGMTAYRDLSIWEMLGNHQTWCKTLHALTSFFSFGFPSQYMTGSLQSPPAALLTAIGIGSVLGSKRRIAIWLLAAWFLMAFIIGGLSPYHVPPNTRIFFMVPLFALFAGIGFQSVFRFASGPYRNIAGVSLSAAIIFLCYYQFHVLSARQLPYNYVSYILRDAQEKPEINRIWIVSTEPSSFDVCKLFLELFRLDNDLVRSVPSQNIPDGINLMANTQKLPMKISIRLPLANAEAWGAAIREHWPKAIGELAVDPAHIEHAFVYTIP